MPEESSLGAPGLTAPGGRPAVSENSAAPDSAAPDSAAPDSAAPDSAAPDSGSLDSGSSDGGSPGSTLPASAPRRRRPLILGVAAVLVAALIAIVAVVLAGRPAAAKLKYTSLPAPCTMLTSGTVARFLPGVSSSPAGAAPGRASKVGACTWSSIAGGEDRTLILQVDMYDSAAGTSSARQAYAKEVPAGNCRCQWYTVTRQAVTGLGDQATVLFTTTSTKSNAGFWTAPAVNLLVRSGNADINVGYTVAGIGRAPAPPSDAALRATTVAMARDVLAALSS
jgi:hypothetical protein